MTGTLNHPSRGRVCGCTTVRACSRDHHYGGVPLTLSLAGVILVLEHATMDADGFYCPVHIDHTGGGCFWLRIQVNAAVLIITTSEGPLGIGDTEAEVRFGGGGWHVTAWVAGHDGWPEGMADGEGPTLDRDGVDSEALPMVVREMAALMNGAQR